VLKEKETNEMHKINFLLINLLLLKITPTCFGYLIGAMLREFIVLASYKPL
jgi:hypothetical protein